MDQKNQRNGHKFGQGQQRQQSEERRNPGQQGSGTGKSGQQPVSAARMRMSPRSPTTGASNLPSP